MTNWEIQGVRLDGKASVDAWDVYVNQNLSVTGTTTLTGTLTANGASTFNSNITQAASQTATLNSPVTINNTLDVDSGLTGDEGITISNTHGSGNPSLILDNGSEEAIFMLNSSDVLNIWSDAGPVAQSSGGALSTFTLYLGAANGTFNKEFLTAHTTSETGGNFTAGEVVINEAGVDMDFRVETENITSAFRVDASADKVKVNVDLDITNTTTTVAGNIALGGNLTGTGDITRTGDSAITGNITGTGDITRTGDFDLTGDITASGTTQAITGSSAINLTGDTTVDGTFKNEDSGTNIPIIEMTDSTNTFEVWKYEYDGTNSASVLTWNPNNEPSHYIKFQDNFGNDSLFILAGATQTQIQSYAANWRYRGGANHITYETSAGANIAKLNMNAGNNFYEQYSGDTEFNPSGLNTANWKFNSSTYTSAGGIPLFGLTETSDLIHMSGDIFATALALTNAPLKQLSDTSANLATKMTRDGEIAFSTDAYEFVGHKATSESYIPSPSVLTFNQDITSTAYAGTINPNYHIGTPPATGLKTPFDGYIVGLSVEFALSPIGVTQMTFAPTINGTTVVPAVVTTAITGTDVYGSVQPHVAPFSAGDRLGIEMGYIGPPPTQAIGATWIELHVVYKMPIV